MAEAIKLLPDGTLNFAGGHNSALDPGAIADNQYYIGINVTAETGALKPRWGLKQLTLDWTATGNYTRASGFVVPFEEVFRSGKFQAFIPYGIGPDRFQIYVVSGFMFLINLVDLSVVVLNPTDQLNVNTDRINWSNAGNFMVVFDFPNLPFILDGVVARRADPSAGEVFVSVMGALNQNRLVVANAGIDWTAGDPVGNQLTPDAPITFLEVLTPGSPYYLDVYQVPTANVNDNVITAMGFLQVLDKSTEIGSLIVATATQIYSYPTYLPRATWQAGSTGQVFGSLLLPTGIVGQRAHVNVGSDYIFMAPSGEVFCFTISRNAQFRWSNSPISREVEKFLGFIDPALAKVTVTATFKNKIFISANPHRVNVYSSEGVLQTDYVSSGLAVIETNNMASLSNQSPPAWAGVWTGTGFMDLVKNGDTLYVAGKYRNRNELYVLDPKTTHDFIEGKTRFIRSVIETKEYTNSDGTVNKKLHSLDLGLRDIKECLTVDVSYRPENSQSYYPWREFNFNAPQEQCGAFPLFPNGLEAQGIRDLNVGGVDEYTCYPPTRDYAYVYKGVQVRLVLSAKDWTLKYLKLKGVLEPVNENEPFCPECGDGTPVPVKCFDYWAIPDEGNC